jgi:hypothetical protein
LAQIQNKCKASKKKRIGLYLKIQKGDILILLKRGHFNFALTY